MLQKRIDQIDAEFQPKADQRRIGRRPLELSTLFGEVSMSNPLFILAVYAPGIAGVTLVWRKFGLVGLGSLFRTHPATEKRIAALHALAPQFQPEMRAALA